VEIFPIFYNYTEGSSGKSYHKGLTKDKAINCAGQQHRHNPGPLDLICSFSYLRWGDCWERVSKDYKQTNWRSRQTLFWPFQSPIIDTWGLICPLKFFYSLPLLTSLNSNYNNRFWPD